MVVRLAKFLLFGLIALFSGYNLINLALFGRLHVRHSPGVWFYFADHPWIVGFYGVVYLITVVVGVLLAYEALVARTNKTSVSRPMPNVTAGAYLRAWLSSYLHPEK